MGLLLSHTVIITELCREWLEAEMPGTGAKWELRGGNVLCGLETDGDLSSPFHPLTMSPRPLLEVDTGLQPHPAGQGDRNAARHSWLDRGDCLFSDVGNISDNQGDLAAGSSWM